MRRPQIVDGPPRAVDVDQVAPNPLNPRLIDPDSPAGRSIRDSIAEIGQIQPSTVVSRRAFLAIHPEHESAIGTADFVQVVGGQRRAAAEQLQPLVVPMAPGSGPSAPPTETAPHPYTTEAVGGIAGRRLDQRRRLTPLHHVGMAPGVADAWPAELHEPSHRPRQARGRPVITLIFYRLFPDVTTGPPQPRTPLR